MLVLIKNVEDVLFCNNLIAKELATTTLGKGSEIFKDVAILSGKCSHCKTHYFADHENYPQDGGPWRRVYLNNAKYLKLGKSLYVDRCF